jgi:hypothetical protein
MTIGTIDYVSERASLENRLLDIGTNLRATLTTAQKLEILDSMVEVVERMDDLDRYHKESNSCPAEAIPR